MDKAFARLTRTIAWVAEQFAAFRRELEECEQAKRPVARKRKRSK